MAEDGGEGGSEGMHQEPSPSGRDPRQMLIIGLAVAVVVLLGVVIGLAVAGGPGNGQSATPTTVPAATSTTSAGPETTTTQTTIPGVITVPAGEDTYVNSGQPEDINGLEDLLEVENDPPETKRALVRFQVADLPEAAAVVTLRLFVVSNTDDVVTVHLVDGPWSQAETNGVNAPPVGEQVASIPPGTSEGSTVDVDVSAVVQGPGTYDFYLVSQGEDSAEYASIESGANPPLLVVDFGSGEASAQADPVMELSGDPVILAGAGDIADCSEEGDSVTAALLDDLVAEHPEAVVFTAGDNAYPDGSPAEFSECYHPTWGRHLDRTRPAPGNHEYNTDDAAGYFEYFGEAAGRAGEGWYTYRAGEWQVFALNSNCDDVGGCGPGSPQETWLRDELAASDAACTLAYWHHPRFSSGSHGGSSEVAGLYQALYDSGADVVVNGHDHDYERFAPQDPQGVHDPVRGIRQFVAGTGGKGLRGFDQLAANSEWRNSSEFGLLVLSLYPGGYEWEFVSEAGPAAGDVGIGACH